MLSRELIDLVNTGEAVAFVGSGVSCDVGLPDWPGLCNATRDLLTGTSVSSDETDRLITSKKFPEAFGSMRRAAGGTLVDQAVTQILSQVATPGRYHNALADWPFRFYVSLNFDDLLDRALEKHGPWVPVGNAAGENRKISAMPKGIVWHPHGGIRFAADKCSRLVLADTDYNEIYPASNVREALAATVRTHRVVFFGFGFSDPDVIRLLELVAQVVTPARPGFAFLAQDISTDSQAKRDEYLRKYNVEVVPYISRGMDHSQLNRLLEMYSPFVLRRSVGLGTTTIATPEYDPVVTSLYVHNCLTEPGTFRAAPDVKAALLRVSILNSLAKTSPLTTAVILRDCESVTRDPEECGAAVASLAAAGMVSVDGDGDVGVVTLLEKGANTSSQASATAQLAADLFRKSLTTRLPTTLSVESGLRVTAVVSSFLNELSTERGLGVAQNLASPGSPQSLYRATALMRSLPEYLRGCNTADEAIAAIAVVVGVLQEPSESEAVYLGHRTQAYFAQHLLGASDGVRNISRLRLTDSCFWLDASLIIRLIAFTEHSGGAEALMLKLLKELKGRLVTTVKLVEEIREHVRWAVDLHTHEGEESPAFIDAAAERNGYHKNVFIEAYSQDPTTQWATFVRYVKEVFKSPTSLVTSEIASSAVKALGISVIDIVKLGKESPDFADLESSLEAEIRGRRMDRLTFKHDRQIVAEAEVAAAVSLARNGDLKIDDRTFSDSFFVSHTRAVDSNQSGTRRISIHPDALTQWLWASVPIGPKEASAIFEQLMMELEVSGIRFVPETTLLHRFGGIIEASSASLKRIVEAHGDILAERYGQTFARELQTARPIDIPHVAVAVSEAAMSMMKSRMEAARAAQSVAEERAKLGGKDREELELLRAKERDRQNRAAHRRRSEDNRKK